MGVSLLSGSSQTVASTSNTTNTNDLNSSTSSSSTSSSSTASGTGTTTQVSGSGTDGSVNSLIGSWKHFSPVLAINALVTENKARVIASPSIATLNGHEASILIGDHYPYVSSTSTAGGSSGGVVNQTQTQYIDIGTKLKVTPFVSPDGWITLKVQPEVSSLIGLVNGNPDISTTSASTEVRVRDNETIVIGGLDSRNTSTTKGGTPGLMSIPVLGWFFHHDSTSVDDGTLTVLITPHIVLMAPASTENTKIAEGANLIQGLLDYAAGMDENRTKDSMENLTISEEQIKTYRRILEQFPQSGQTAFCLYKIAYIYVKDFGDCAAAEEALTQMEEATPRSPYIKAVEILVNACMSVKDKGGKEWHGGS
jgi:type II secretory pathway component GspD/PulD (secretin)